jgi:hypothetical protein
VACFAGDPELVARLDFEAEVLHVHVAHEALVGGAGAAGGVADVDFGYVSVYTDDDAPVDDAVGVVAGHQV